MKKVDNWILDSINKVISTGNAADVHVDDFIDTAILTETELVRASIELFSLFVKSFRERKVEALIIYLSIELTEYGDRLKGAPDSFKKLCKEFDSLSVPEIILYKPVPLIYPPQVEIYRKPLFFKEFINYHEMSFFYKEDRTLDMVSDNLDFRRELTVIHMPNN